MSTETLVFLILLVLVLGSLPAWPYATSWGYAPTGLLSVLLVFFLIWALAGGRPLFRSSVGQDIRATAADAGDDIQSAGRRTADSIRRTVQ